MLPLGLVPLSARIKQPLSAVFSLEGELGSPRFPKLTNLS
jgi:hypothetical protein